MSRPPAAAGLLAGKAHCLSAPCQCGSMVPRAPKLPAPVERLVLKTSDSSPGHQRQTKPRKKMSSTRKSVATRPTNYTAVGALSSQPGEANKTSSFASCCGRRSGSNPPPLRRSARVRNLSPDSALFPPESPPLPSLRGAVSKTTKTRRPTFGPRKMHDYSLLTAGTLRS